MSTGLMKQCSNTDDGSLSGACWSDYAVKDNRWVLTQWDVLIQFWQRVSDNAVTLAIISSLSHPSYVFVLSLTAVAKINGKSKSKRITPELPSLAC